MEINSWLQRMATSNQYKDFVSVVDLGNTTEGRSMLALKIGNPGNNQKVAFWIDAGIHPREWISIAVAIWIIDQLVHTRPKYLDNVDLYILPVLNPDGYEFTRNYDRFWRHTRSNCTSLSPYECCAYITLHSFFGLWMYSYSYSIEVDPPHKDELVALSERAVAAMSQVGNTNYSAITSAELYPAAGVSDDWVTGVLGVKYSFTIELPPDDPHLNEEGFVVDESLIVPIAKEAWAGISTVIDRVVQESQCPCACCGN
uniref:Peptidase M14 carboxypeptidase A domain-containing protein n=1 Tax=Plectus sambesii TaxID=2011161 RepID=A0A914W562_9BILA